MNMWFDKLVLGNTGRLIYVSSPTVIDSERYLPKCEVARFGNMEDGFRELIVYADDPRWMMTVAENFVKPIYSYNTDQNISIVLNFMFLAVVGVLSGTFVSIIIGLL